MNQDLLNRLTADVDALSVPPVDFSAIQVRASRLGTRSSSRRPIASVAAALVVFSSLAAAATQFTHLNLTNKFHTWQLYGPSKITWHPSQATLVNIQQRAPYRIVWPASLPTGTSLRMINNIASEVIFLDYQCADKGQLWITIAPKNSAAVNPNLTKWAATLKLRGGESAEWQTGEQRVRLTSTCLTTSQINKIRSAMSSPGKPT